MKFSYQKYPANPNSAFPDRKRALRPVIPIGLIGKDKNTYRDDFFKLYAVEFDLSKERLELKPRYK